MGTSVTREDNGSIREKTSHETTFFLGLGDEVTVTRNGNGEIVNVQEGWGR